jgi:hypothetical protein
MVSHLPLACSRLCHRCDLSRVSQLDSSVYTSQAHQLRLDNGSRGREGLISRDIVQRLIMSEWTTLRSANQAHLDIRREATKHTSQELG